MTVKTRETPGGGTGGFEQATLAATPDDLTTKKIWRPGSLATLMSVFVVDGDISERIDRLEELAGNGYGDLLARSPEWDTLTDEAFLNLLNAYTDGDTNLGARKQRRLIEGLRTAEAAATGHPDDENITVDADAGRLQLLPGDVVFDVPAEPESIWGDGSESLWAKGETTMLYADTGLGKTTLAQRVGLASIGIGPSTVLGYPVEPLPDGERILYVAADRPRQAMRSLRRMVDPQHRDLLRERWRWETLNQLRASDPDVFLRACEQANATRIVLDSLKDLAPGALKDEEPANAVVDAWQRCIAHGIDVCALHHPRKGQSATAPPASVDEVYGSKNLTNSCGSVLAIYGASGSGLVRVSQLKQPANQIPDMDVFIDYTAGTLERRNYRDLNEFLQRGGWVTVRQVAAFMGAKPEQDVTDADKKRAQRELDRLAAKQVIEPRKVGQTLEYRWDTPALVVEQ